MSDVFISYARSTAAQAQKAAEALRALGHQVWLDDQIPAHRSFREVIEERLLACKAVLVIWSADATRSEWVLSEASRGRAAGKLVQLRVDESPLPMPFDQIECARLVGWGGDPEAVGWRKVVASIAELAGAPPPPPPGSLPAEAAREPRATVLAVLAFDNLSGDSDMTYFSDGVSEEILQTVARGAELKVIGRGSSFQFRGADKAASKVATALNATHVLDGSVRRSGSKVRVSAHLIECDHETTLWSDRFDRELSEVFALQDEIAAAVAQALKVAFAPTSSQEPIDPAAYDIYLRARTLSVDRNAAARVELLQQAVARSPSLAPAWALLCQARTAQIRHGPRPKPFDVLKTDAMAAAETALRLDPQAGSAYAALSALEPMACYQAREALLEKARLVAPNDPETLTGVGSFYNHVGFVEEAVGYLKRAYDLDPLYPRAADVYGAVLHAAGHEAEAFALTDVWIARWPEYPTFITGRVNAATARHDWPAFDVLAATAAANGVGDPNLQAALRFGVAIREGDRDLGSRIVRRMERQIAQSGAVSLFTVFSALAADLVEEAFTAIDQSSYEFMFREDGQDPSGFSNPGTIFDPVYCGKMMRDPRFMGLCAKLGLCDYWVDIDRWPDCAGALSEFYDFKAEARKLTKADRGQPTPAMAVNP